MRCSSAGGDLTIDGPQLPQRLPRAVEADPRAARLLAWLVASARPLRAEGAASLPVTPIGVGLAAALRSARSAGRVVRGLEAAEPVLAAEARGQRLADQRAGAPRRPRISRLLLVASDGADRFYRQVEALLRRHGERLLAIRVEADAEALGGLLFGPGSRARLVLVEHKDAVAAVLLAIADEAGRETVGSGR